MDGSFTMANGDRKTGYGGAPENGGTPHGWFLLGKILLKIDDDWGYPYSRKPPYMFEAWGPQAPILVPDI